MELDLNLVHVLRKGMALEVRVGDVKEGEVVELAARDDPLEDTGRHSL
eukprot:CAMPEP_0174729720 /NCGR_PEP_ID=MMETSP1094-20130205/54250_1 /TAXON_ID=156173 /ORGANISM="Chrysochromulina brevifilum, Strain UTEX LB 985" /LENGTH=47 /DNA_ID= /DNA_START= /DNA_END= /DNA_ORIENTATION=